MRRRIADGLRHRLRRGGVLMEVIVSMAIFVACGTFTLQATSNVLDALDRAGREQRAVDLARSKLAELELGLVSLQDLQDATIDAVGSFEELGDPRDEDAPGRRRWLIDVQTQASEVPGLSVVEVTVQEEASSIDTTLRTEGSSLVRFTLRQLVRLREQRVESYEQDDMLRGLPEEDR